MLSPWTPEKMELARREAESWRGTPHRHHVAVKGVGIDCVHLVVAILTAAGFVNMSMIPPYRRDIGMRGAFEKITHEFSRHVPVEHAEAPYQFGDILLFDSNVNVNHCAILIDGKIWHSIYNAQVGPYAMEDFKSKIKKAIRLK